MCLSTFVRKQSRIQKFASMFLSCRQTTKGLFLEKNGPEEHLQLLKLLPEDTSTGRFLMGPGPEVSDKLSQHNVYCVSMFSNSPRTISYCPLSILCLAFGVCSGQACHWSSSLCHLFIRDGCYHDQAWASLASISLFLRFCVNMERG